MAAPTEIDRITSPLGRMEAFLAVFLTWVALYLPGLGATKFHGEEGRRILPAAGETLAAENLPLLQDEGVTAPGRNSDASALRLHVDQGLVR
ncbi:MAG: hypothetical protein M1376_00830 [Planctomycetes bacterium]|nr:hypothetical protein [Planctomycetota bacterium]